MAISSAAAVESMVFALASSMTFSILQLIQANAHCFREPIRKDIFRWIRYDFIDTLTALVIFVHIWILHPIEEAFRSPRELRIQNKNELIEM